MRVAADRRIARSGVVRRLIKPLLGRTAVAGREPVAAAPRNLSEPLPARRPMPADIRPDRKLLDRVASLTWYQTIDLGQGVVTPGFVDERDQVSCFQLPQSLTGMRCLDVMTRDGFWAFEMERRGAAEVVAVDVSHPSAASSFGLACDVLGSRAERRTLRVYDLSPQLLGAFDLIFVNDLLGHVGDPQRALDCLRSVCKGALYLSEPYHPGLEPFGDACLAEYSPRLGGEPIFWHMSTETIRRMVRSADFDTVDELARFSVRVPSDSSTRAPRWRVAIRATVGSPEYDSSRVRGAASSTMSAPARVALAEPE
jgi:tRNA (mo5U34)-methyltransferase